MTVFLNLCEGVTDARADKTQSLEGLQAVLVRIKSPADMAQDGLSVKRIKSEVEARLKKLGISILTDANWENAYGRPYIQVTINGSKIQDNWKFYTYSITLRLFQDVTLVRKPETGIIQASTWFHEVSGHGYLDDIRTRVIEAMELFAQDFNTAN